MTSTQDVQVDAYIAAAAALDAIGPPKRTPAKPKSPLEPRADLLGALAASPVAQSA